MSEFTKEQLRHAAEDSVPYIIGPTSDPMLTDDLAAFALAQMEGRENAEAERDELLEVIEAWNGNVPAEAWQEVAAYNAGKRRARERAK